MNNHKNRPGTMKKELGTMKTGLEPWITMLLSMFWPVEGVGAGISKNVTDRKTDTQTLRHKLRKCSIFVTNRHFSSLTGGPSWPFRCLDDKAQSGKFNENILYIQNCKKINPLPASLCHPYKAKNAAISLIQCTAEAALQKEAFEDT